MLISHLSGIFTLLFVSVVNDNNVLTGQTHVTFIAIFSGSTLRTVALLLSVACLCPSQRHQSPLLVTLYRDLLGSHSDTSNIESLEFPFHTPRQRVERGREVGTTLRGSGGEGRAKRTVGLRGNNTSGTLGGGHMSRDGGREHPKVRPAEDRLAGNPLVRRLAAHVFSLSLSLSAGKPPPRLTRYLRAAARRTRSQRRTTGLTARPVMDR